MAGQMLPICPSRLGLRNWCVGEMRLVPDREGGKLFLFFLEYHHRRVYRVVSLGEAAVELPWVAPNTVRKSLNGEPEACSGGWYSCVLCDPWPDRGWCNLWTCSLLKANYSESAQEHIWARRMSLNSIIFGEDQQGLGAPSQTRAIFPEAQYKIGGLPMSPKNYHTWLPHTRACQDRERARTDRGNLELWAAFLRDMEYYFKGLFKFLNQIISKVDWEIKDLKDYINQTNQLIGFIHLAHLSCELNFCWLCYMYLRLEKSGASSKKSARFLVRRNSVNVSSQETII